jgi:hypothetical protein
MITERVMTAARAAAQIIEQDIKAQSPSRRIAAGLRVDPVIQDGEISFEVTFSDNTKYGVYLDRGTGRYRASENEVGVWNPNPGKGKGGIIPRFFTVISEAAVERVGEVLESAFVADMEEELAKRLEG